jgi:hypothetical protein
LFSKVIHAYHTDGRWWVDQKRDAAVATARVHGRPTVVGWRGSGGERDGGCSTNFEDTKEDIDEEQNKKSRGDCPGL